MRMSLNDKYFTLVMEQYQADASVASSCKADSCHSKLTFPRLTF